MHSLSPAEVQALVDEMAADPDDVHIPASVRYAETRAPIDEMAADPRNSTIHIPPSVRFVET